MFKELTLNEQNSTREKCESNNRGRIRMERGMSQKIMAKRI